MWTGLRRPAGPQAGGTGSTHTNGNARRRATSDIAPGLVPVRPISVDSPLGLRGQFTAVPRLAGITGASSTSTGRKGHMTEATLNLELHGDRHPHVGHHGAQSTGFTGGLLTRPGNAPLPLDGLPQSPHRGARSPSTGLRTHRAVPFMRQDGSEGSQFRSATKHAGSNVAGRASRSRPERTTNGQIALFPCVAKKEDHSCLA